MRVTHLSSAVHLTSHFNILDEILLLFFFFTPIRFPLSELLHFSSFSGIHRIRNKIQVDSHIPHLQHLGLPCPSELQNMLMIKNAITVMAIVLLLTSS